MGTRYTAVFHASAQVDAPLIAARLFAAVDKVDRQMSTWKPDSDLNRLNAAPQHQWQTMPEELITVLEASLQVGRQSSGAFDIGVGDLVGAWGFGPGSGQPDERQIDFLKERTRLPSTEALEIDRARGMVRKKTPIMLDLSGIAKGYGVDALAHCLDGFGITSYLVGIDGEMRARGLKPDGRAWAVALEKPLPGVREAMGVMELTDTAIATSGDYRHRIRINGRIQSHTMDPTLRKPSDNGVASVTVIAPTCMLADAWATALLVLGEDAGARLARERGLEALFVLHHDKGFRQLYVGREQQVG